MEEQHAESVATLKGPAYSVTSEVSHQHKFPEGGKLDVPSAPKEKTLHFPVPKDINPKSGFTIPPGALEKPPIPDTLSGKNKDVFLSSNSRKQIIITRTYDESRKNMTMTKKSLK